MTFALLADLWMVIVGPLEPVLEPGTVLEPSAYNFSPNYLIPFHGFYMISWQLICKIVLQPWHLTWARLSYSIENLASLVRWLIDISNLKSRVIHFFPSPWPTIPLPFFIVPPSSQAKTFISHLWFFPFPDPHSNLSAHPMFNILNIHKIHPFFPPPFLPKSDFHYNVLLSDLSASTLSP